MGAIPETETVSNVFFNDFFEAARFPAARNSALVGCEPVELILSRRGLKFLRVFPKFFSGVSKTIAVGLLVFGAPPSGAEFSEAGLSFKSTFKVGEESPPVAMKKKSKGSLTYLLKLVSMSL
jgi:hypothetical protein